jgi:hypothetical protein
VVFPTHADWAAQVSLVPSSPNVIVWAQYEEVPMLVHWPGKKVLRKFGQTGVASVAVAPSGKTMATYGRTPTRAGGVGDPLIRLWDLITGQEWGQLAQQPPSTGLVGFAAGGYSLVVQHQDGVRLWEVASRQERVFIPGWPAAVTLSHDGRLLLRLALYDTNVTVWDLTLRQKIGPLDRVQLRPEQLRELYKDLAGKDGKRAYAALWRLASAPEQTVPFLADRIRQIPGVDRKQLPRLIADLGAAQFARRDHAMRELLRFGRWAHGEMVAQLQKDPPLEMKRRLEQLLQKLQAQLFSPEQILAARIVEVLEQIDTPASRQLLATLRDGDRPQFSEIAQEALARKN